MPAIYSLWIVGRNGGLVYSRVRPLKPHRGLLKSAESAPEHGPDVLLVPVGCVQEFLTLPGIDFNDKLRLASSW